MWFLNTGAKKVVLSAASRFFVFLKFENGIFKADEEGAQKLMQKVNFGKGNITIIQNHSKS